jgi:uncharacterized protein YjlB
MKSASETQTTATGPQNDARRNPAGESLQVEAHPLTAQGLFPNNPRLPALVYRGAFQLPAYGDTAGTIERTFSRHGWSGGWRDGVYNYQHYHSTAHEVLGCYAGRASVQLGGPSGPVVELKRGDVLVLPAGVAHKSTESSKDFSVVGAYAGGRSYDMRRGRPDEQEVALRSIAEVPLPEADPVLGAEGPLLRHWTAE